MSAKPVYIFRELLHHLDEHRIVAPSYSFLQELVSKALTAEQHRVTTIVRRALTVADTEALEHLLEEGAGLYALTQLKREPKDFSAGAMKHERQRGEQLQGFVPLGPTGVTAARPFPESIKYYASLVMYYSVYRLKRLDVWLRLLYLLCFVYHRYQRVHDHMLDSLIHHVRQYTDAAQAAAKDRCIPHGSKATSTSPKPGMSSNCSPTSILHPDTLPGRPSYRLWYPRAPEAGDDC